MLSDRELEREGRRLVRVLAARNACLIAKASRKGADVFWHVCAPDGTRKRGVRAAEDGTVRALLERNWLAQDDQGRTIAGRAARNWMATTDARCEPATKAQPRNRAAGCSPTDAAAPAPLQTNPAECPLTWLRNRKDGAGVPILSEHQFAAGERLRRDFEASGLRPRVTASWDLATSQGRRGRRSDYREHDPSDAAIDARRRFHAALDTVGPDLASVLTDVCCFLTGLEALERDKGWPRRSAKVVLQIALSQLATHYGMCRRESDGRPTVSNDRKAPVRTLPADAKTRSN